LAADPIVLLADEPTAEVDAATAGGILALLAQRRAEGRATIVVTHSAAVAERCDRVLRLRDGRIADA
jgi:putative ABC transport system ATP-binding protein